MSPKKIRIPDFIRKIAEFHFKCDMQISVLCRSEGSIGRVRPPLEVHLFNCNYKSNDGGTAKSCRTLINFCPSLSSNRILRIGYKTKNRLRKTFLTTYGIEEVHWFLFHLILCNDLLVETSNRKVLCVHHQKDVVFPVIYIADLPKAAPHQHME